MERLRLSAKRWFQHYGGISGFFLIYPLTLVFIFIEFFINTGFDIHLVFIIYLGMIVWMILNQYLQLNYRVIRTSLSLEESKKAAKYAIESLKWELKIEEPAKFEIYNFIDSDVRNQRGEMIIVEFRKDCFLITSICKLETIKPQMGFTFGKNKENEDNCLIFYKEYEYEAYLKSHQ